MENLVIAIMMALQTLFPKDVTGYSIDEYNQKIREKAEYIYENNLYREQTGGAIIDPGVTL
jgi:hypothetical protein